MRLNAAIDFILCWPGPYRSPHTLHVKTWLWLYWVRLEVSTECNEPLPYGSSRHRRSGIWKPGLSFTHNITFTPLTVTVDLIEDLANPELEIKDYLGVFSRNVSGTFICLSLFVHVLDITKSFGVSLNKASTIFVWLSSHNVIVFYIFHCNSTRCILL